MSSVLGKMNNKDLPDKQVHLVAALQLYKNHELSFGKAAELAGISKNKFLIALNKNEIDFIDYDPADLEAELERCDAGI